MAIRTGTVRQVWFAIRTVVGTFLAAVGGIFVSFFDFYILTLIKQVCLGLNFRFDNRSFEFSTYHIDATLAKTFMLLFLHK